MTEEKGEKTVDLPKGDAIVVERASKHNLVRDIGIYLVALALLANFVLIWVTTSNLAESERELGEYYKEELRAFRRRETENLKKVAETSLEQHKETRRVLAEAVERLEKRLKEK